MCYVSLVESGTLYNPCNDYLCLYMLHTPYILLSTRVGRVSIYWSSVNYAFHVIDTHSLLCTEHMFVQKGIDNILCLKLISDPCLVYAYIYCSVCSRDVVGETRVAITCPHAVIPVMMIRYKNRPMIYSLDIIKEAIVRTEFRAEFRPKSD